MCSLRISEEQPRRACIIVPFYRAPDLVETVFRSLQAIGDELNALDVRVVFVNDSPDDPGLRSALAACLRDPGGLDLQIATNPENLGFIGACNRAMTDCLERREDAILLNSDTYVFKGAIAELQAVAYSDPMIGFASPRTNNGTLCTLPHSSARQTLTSEAGFRRFNAISGALPRLSYVPTAVGFCLYIKWKILAEFGLFDPIYGRGYNEENDLVMRANRYGYRAVIANRAFVWHQSEASFSQTGGGRAALEEQNAAILASRFPEYPRLIHAYFSSQAYRAETLLEGLCPDADGRLAIAFDFSSFGTYHNGTFEAGKRLLAAALACWPPSISIAVVMGEAAWRFHGIGDLGSVEWVEPSCSDRTFAAILRFGQPFEIAHLEGLVYRSPVVALFMLDTIAVDCGHLGLKFDQDLWRFTLEWSDIVWTNSQFTADQFKRRYFIGDKTELIPSLHSVDLDEYRDPKPASGADIPTDALLIIGNTFTHKSLRPTVERLAKALPGRQIIALGLESCDLPDVTAIALGNLTDTEMAAYYTHAAAAVFPSHYEGFGFPILHAIARSTPVFARALPPFREIVDNFREGGANVHWFETTDELVDMLRGATPEWLGDPAIGEVGGWERSAREVWAGLERRISSVDAGFVARRLDHFSARFVPRQEPTVSSVHPGSDGQNMAINVLSETDRAAVFIGLKCEALMRRAFAVPIMYRGARWVWRSMRRFSK